MMDDKQKEFWEDLEKAILELRNALSRSEEDTNSFHLEYDSLDEADIPLLNALELCEDASREDARIVTLDYDPSGKISGMTITNGNGITVYDEDYGNKVNGNGEEIFVDYEEILPQKFLEHTTEAPVVIVKSSKDFEEINRAIKEYRKRNHLSKKDLLKGWVKDRIVSFAKMENTIEYLLATWNEPLILHILHAISHEISQRHQDQYKIHYMKEIYRSWQEKEIDRKEKLQAIKEHKKEEKKADNYWKPPERLSREYKNMSREEKLILKEMIKRYPQNIPPFSDWRIFHGHAKTSEDVPPLKITNKEAKKIMEEMKMKIRTEKAIQDREWEDKKKAMIEKKYEVKDKVKTKTKKR